MAENEQVVQKAAEEVKKEYDPEKGIRPYLFDGKRKFNISKFDTADVGDFDHREDAVEEFVDNLHRINVLQQKLYASARKAWFLSSKPWMRRARTALSAQCFPRCPPMA